MVTIQDFSVANIERSQSKDHDAKEILNNIKRRPFRLQTQSKIWAPSVFNHVLKLHKNGKALQPVCSAGVCCVEWPPLPLPSLHRVGGEAPSLLAQSYTGLQRTCNQIKHTLHMAQNASIFHEMFLSIQTSLNQTTHNLCAKDVSYVIWVGHVLLKARTASAVLWTRVFNCKQLACHGIT